jgi:hypothetical protein
MACCPAIKANGERCKGDAIPGADWCYSHDPDRAEERRRNASRGGKSGGGGRSSGELAEIKALLSELTNRVLGGEGVEALETGRAAVANQLVNTRLRAVELERRIRESDELEARIEELEQAAGH